MSNNRTYDRYAGINSLPGDPLNPKALRPFRVDEDGNVIYRDQEIDAVRSLGEERPIQLAELGNVGWNGPKVMGSQGQKDGRVLKEAYDHFFPAQDPNAPPPPASRNYPLPPGTKAVAWDPQHRFVLDKDGKLVEHPDYKRDHDATATNKMGVARDLGIIGISAAPFLGGAGVGLRAAQGMVGKNVAKEIYDLEKGRGSRKGSR